MKCEVQRIADFWTESHMPDCDHSFPGRRPVARMIRFDEDRFAYSVPDEMTKDDALLVQLMFEEAWPGKKLIILQGETEFTDLTGQAVEVPV